MKGLIRKGEFGYQGREMVWKVNLEGIGGVNRAGRENAKLCPPLLPFPKHSKGNMIAGLKFFLCQPERTPECLNEWHWVRPGLTLRRQRRIVEIARGGLYHVFINYGVGCKASLTALGLRAITVR